DRLPARPAGAEGPHPGPAAPLPQARPRQGRARPRQGQEALRQARLARRARGAPRCRARVARPRLKRTRITSLPLSRRPAGVARPRLCCYTYVARTGMPGFDRDGRARIASRGARALVKTGNAITGENALPLAA